MENEPIRQRRPPPAANVSATAAPGGVAAGVGAAMPRPRARGEYLAQAQELPEDEGPPESQDGDEDDDSRYGEEDDAASTGGNSTSSVTRNTLASVDWDEVFVCPLNVRFTQEKIHPFFYRRGPIVNVLPKIRPVLRSVSDGEIEEDIVELVPPFSSIHCLRKGDELWSLDNRRLYALQLAAMEQWPTRCRIRVYCRDRLPRHKFKTQYRKFNTTNGGRSIIVTARYQQFDAWSWFDRAVEYEWYTLSQRLGCLLSTFEILPVIGALLFRTGLTGFSSRVPLILGFILSFCCDLVRQRVPAIEKKLCEMHVQAIMDGEVQPDSVCCKRFSSARRSVFGGEEDPSAATPMSAPQLAATVALTLVLVLPYILGAARERLRSSLLSCWMGVACVLVVQLVSAFRRHAAAAQAPRLSPKGRPEDDDEKEDDEKDEKDDDAD